MVQRDASIVGINFSTDCIRFRQRLSISPTSIVGGKGIAGEGVEQREREGVCQVIGIALGLMQH